MSEQNAMTALAELSERTLKLMDIPADRRKDRRLRLTAPLPAHFGGVDALIVDLGARGARLRHNKPVKPGIQARLTFEWPGGPFRALVRILASRIIVAAPKPRFESRLQFLEVSPDSKKLLERVIQTMTDGQLRQWVANFMGDAMVPIDRQNDRSRGLLRFRLINERWTAAPAGADEAAPADGFIVPASLEPGEINVMCAAYSRLDSDGRQLMRLFASAALAA